MFVNCYTPGVENKRKQAWWVVSIGYYYFTVSFIVSMCFSHRRRYAAKVMWCWRICAYLNYFNKPVLTVPRFVSPQLKRKKLTWFTEKRTLDEVENRMISATNCNHWRLKEINYFFTLCNNWYHEETNCTTFFIVHFLYCICWYFHGYLKCW